MYLWMDFIQLGTMLGYLISLKYLLIRLNLDFLQLMTLYQLLDIPRILIQRISIISKQKLGGGI